jgi:PAS domain S-box-containing protein
MKLLHAAGIWKDWGLVSRLMAAVSIAIIVAGAVQTYLLVAESASDAGTRHVAEAKEAGEFLAPLVADQAVLGDYATIEQLLRKQVLKTEILTITWTDPLGKIISATDDTAIQLAPGWFRRIAPIDHVDFSIPVVSNGADYGILYVEMTTVSAHNRLWEHFVKQVQIVFITLLLMLQFIWLIFRGNLGTLRMLAVNTTRFSEGDHSIRIDPAGAPEVRLAAEAFNDMADSIEKLIGSLAQSESRNRLLAATVAQSSEAIWTCDLDGCVTSWNAGARVMFGYDLNEIIAKRVPIGGGATSLEDETRRIARARKGESFTYEMPAVTKDGTKIDIWCAVAPLQNESNVVVGEIYVAHDVTERNRVDAELRAARAAADSANKAKSSFLARMSHEIRTPMNGVLGMTELLIESGLNATQHAYAETVQRSGKSLLGIINDILDFSKIEAGKLELEHIDFDLRQSIEDTIDMLAERAQSKGLEVTCAMPVDFFARVRGDPLRLSQVLTNLLGNAIKFTDNGEVGIYVSCVEDGERSLTLRIAVSDTGCGLSADAQSRIFDNFSQADGSTTRRYGGTGLGLAISKQLVEMMGGELRLESTLGVGSTFWFEIRLDKSDEQPQADRFVHNKLEGVRVLIVEDNATLRGILHAQVSNWRMSCQTVESAESVLDMLTRASARRAPYDVVIIDKGTGGIGIAALAKAIKSDAAVANARLIMLMPMGRHIDLREMRSGGFDMCLTKPVRQSALYDCLVTVMAGASNVDFKLDVEDAENAEDANKWEPKIVHRVNRGCLLLAEDNVVNQQLALVMLQLEGYIVTVANNGLEAVAAFSTGTFDAILMDCHMPDMDGFEATRRIRELETLRNLKRTPVIALTANAMQQDRDECLNASMDDFLSKPYTRVQLRTLLDRWAPEKIVEPDLAGASPEPTAAFGTLIDRAVQDGLREIEQSGIADFVNRFIGTYLTDSPNIIRAIKEAAETGNRPDLSRAAHTLQGSSANVGALGLSNLCKALELMARTTDGNPSQLIAEIESLYCSIRTALVAEQASHAVRA